MWDLSDIPCTKDPARGRMESRVRPGRRHLPLIGPPLGCTSSLPGSDSCRPPATAIYPRSRKAKVYSFASSPLKHIVRRTCPRKVVQPSFASSMVESGVLNLCNSADGVALGDGPSRSCCTAFGS